MNKILILIKIIEFMIKRIIFILLTLKICDSRGGHGGGHSGGGGHSSHPTPAYHPTPTPTYHPTPVAVSKPTYHPTIVAHTTPNYHATIPIYHQTQSQHLHLIVVINSRHPRYYHRVYL